jgi:AAA+ superfamily predicted ATPase
MADTFQSSQSAVRKLVADDLIKAYASLSQIYGGGSSQGDWRDTTFGDLQTGDHVILDPTFCGLTRINLTRWISPYNWVVDDSKDSPVYNGKYGQSNGVVRRSSTRTLIYISWKTSGHWEFNDPTGDILSRKIYLYGLVLQNLYLNQTQPVQQVSSTVIPAGKSIASTDSETIEEVKPDPPKNPITFDDVILSKKKKNQILEAIEQINHYDLIYNQWGFGDKIDKGRGIPLLFFGPPGTGKTMMGQAIANKFGYKLTVVTTAEIQSSTPGGAERAIKSFFKAAKDDGHTILLWDECDSLIFDRTGAGPILAAEVNAVLMEIEKYHGIVIFTTNRIDSLDEAFERRLALKMEFPMPTAKQRLKIWKNMYPERAPLAKDITWENISQVEMSGGHIKNVVLKSARRAALGSKLITNDIIWDCIEEEVESRDQYHDARKSVPRAIGPEIGMGKQDNQNGITIDRAKDMFGGNQ